MLKVLSSRTLARLNLIRSASYLASLLVAGNCNLTAYFRISPSGDIRTTLAPSAYLVANPPCLLLGFFFFLRISEFCNEIDEDLDFDCYPRPILYVKLAKLYSPLDKAPCCIYLVQRLSYQWVYHDNNGMCLEVVVQFSGGDY